MLLQVLDNGRLTDGKGRTVNFRNTIIIMTSNVGSEFSRAMSRMGFAASEESSAKAKEEEYRNRIQESLRSRFRPEFLNRLDEIIIFNALDKKVISQIVEIQLKQLTEHLKGRGMKLAIDSSAKKYITEHGFDPEYGARPIKRLIQKAILDNLADRIIKGEIKDGSKIRVRGEASGIRVTA